MKRYFERYCDNIANVENYEAAKKDDFKGWNCHHRKEELYSQKELKERNEYFDVSPEDLIFLTVAEHKKLESHCKRQSEAMKGKKHSEEHNRKISEANKGKLINHKSLSKKVLCIETEEIFESIRDAERKMGIYHDNISKACRGKCKTSGGYHWKFV